MKIKLKWLCDLQDMVHTTKSMVCGGKGAAGSDTNKPQYKVKDIIHPSFLIPLPAPNCNEKWDYKKAGADWTCKCEEGDNQSPIDLPPVKKAIRTVISPLFQFESVPAKADQDAHDGLVQSGEYHRIYYREGALRLYANTFGKIVTLDGAGYYCNQIDFHTPSEHKINNKSFDMEMKVICYAKTEGDFGKMLTLSFMFKKQPGAYNKFLDRLDYLNLPNPEEKFQQLKEEMFIPNIFMDEDISGNGDMIPFSFFNYQGSTTQPPCNEKTIVMVASEPLYASHTTLDLFREALSVSDKTDAHGRILESPKNLENRREVQPLKGRPVFHYDKSSECPVYKNTNGNDHHQKEGHYEKRTTKMFNYFHVNSDKPSGLPNAFVVTNAEAQGFLGRYDDLPQ